MWLAAVRDIAIVLLALESLIIGILLVLMLLQIRQLVRLLREEIAPILNSANETARTMRGTANFISDTVVDPVIQVRSYSAGIMQTLRSIFYIRRHLRTRPSATVTVDDQRMNRF